jgi:predicted HicB family RNase H-like nuclease
MPPALHDQLIAQAKEQGVSLNALMVALLAGGVGFKLAD